MAPSGETEPGEKKFVEGVLIPKVTKRRGRLSLDKFLTFMESTPPLYTGPVAEGPDNGLIGPLRLVTAEGRPMPRDEALMEVVYRIAIGRPSSRGATVGQMQAIEMIWAYLYGRPTQGIEVSGPDGGPIQNADPTVAMTSEARIRRLMELQAKLQGTHVTAANGPTKPETPDGK